MKIPKILTICSNSFVSSNANGRTLMNLLYNASPENLYEFYISGEDPDFDKCGSYYQVSDNDIIKSLLGKNVGRIITANNKSESKINIVSNKKKNNNFLRYMRQLLWGLNTWQNRKFWHWINNFSPEAILLFSGNNAFLDKIAWQISDKYSIPIVLFNCEDYYFQPVNSNNIFAKLNKNFCNRIFRNTMNRIGGVIYNSDKIKKTYKTEFPDVKSIVLYQPGTKFNITKEKNNNIVYLGNINQHRVKPLTEIGNVLKEKGEKLHVYGSPTTEEIKNIIGSNKNIIFHGSVSYEECCKIMSESKIVIHCDNLDNAWELKHAMSCKTGDCLSCGTPLFAYGPEESAVMDYYIKNNCAMVCTKREDLKTKLFEAIDNEKLMNEYLNNALKLASENHNIEKTSEKFYDFVNEIIKKYRLKNNENINF